MKKLMKVAVFAMALCLLLTGCEALSNLPIEIPFLHQHEWQDATCTAPKSCACGEIEGEALGHTWVDATCTAAKTCSVCAATEGEALGHTAGTEATCTTAQTCTVCNTELVAALGHTAGAEATCTTAQICTVCNTELVAALGHTPGTEATCTTAQICTACNTELVAAGHKLVDGACTVCGATFYAFNFDHKVFDKEDTKSLNGIDWTLVAEWPNKHNEDQKLDYTFKSVDSAETNKAKNIRGQQFSSGSATAHIDWMTLTSTTALTNVSKIKIRTCGASGFVGTVTITVGGVEVGKYTLGTTYNDVDGYDYDYYNYEVNVENLSGVVEFKFEQPETQKAFYIGGISIDYAK